jgi:hypothetical protein
MLVVVAVVQEAHTLLAQAGRVVVVLVDKRCPDLLLLELPTLEVVEVGAQLVMVRLMTVEQVAQVAPAS